MLNNTHHYDQFWAWQKKRHAATAMEKKVSEAVTSLGHVLVSYPDVLVSEEALVSEDRRPLQKPHAHAIQKPRFYDSATKMCDSEKMGSSTASTYIFTYIYIIYIYFTVYNI